MDRQSIHADIICVVCVHPLQSAFNALPFATLPWTVVNVLDGDAAMVRSFNANT